MKAKCFFLPSLVKKKVVKYKTNVLNSSTVFDAVKRGLFVCFFHVGYRWGLSGRTNINTECHGETNTSQPLFLHSCHGCFAQRSHYLLANSGNHGGVHLPRSVAVFLAEAEQGRKYGLRLLLNNVVLHVQVSHLLFPPLSSSSDVLQTAVRERRLCVFLPCLF